MPGIARVPLLRDQGRQLGISRTRGLTYVTCRRRAIDMTNESARCRNGIKLHAPIRNSDLAPGEKSDAVVTLFAELTGVGVKKRMSSAGDFPENGPCNAPLGVQCCKSRLGFSTRQQKPASAKQQEAQRARVKRVRRWSVSIQGPLLSSFPLPQHLFGLSPFVQVLDPGPVCCAIDSVSYHCRRRLSLPTRLTAPGLDGGYSA